MPLDRRMNRQTAIKIENAFRRESRRRRLAFFGCIAIICSAIVLVALIASSNSYECSSEEIVGVVADFTMTRGSGFRSINMNKIAVVKMSDGGTNFLMDSNYHINQKLNMRRCRSKLFGKVKYVVTEEF